MPWSRRRRLELSLSSVEFDLIIRSLAEAVEYLDNQLSGETPEIPQKQMLEATKEFHSLRLRFMSLDRKLIESAERQGYPNVGDRNEEWIAAGGKDGGNLPLFLTSASEEGYQERPSTSKQL